MLSSAAPYHFLTLSQRRTDWLTRMTCGRAYDHQVSLQLDLAGEMLVKLTMCTGGRRWMCRSTVVLLTPVSSQGTVSFSALSSRLPFPRAHTLKQLLQTIPSTQFKKFYISLSVSLHDSVCAEVVFSLHAGHCDWDERGLPCYNIVATLKG